MAKNPKRAARSKSENPDIDEDRNKDQKAGDAPTDPAAEGNGDGVKVDSHDDVAKQGDQPDAAPPGESGAEKKVKQATGDAASRPDPAGRSGSDEASAAKETPEQKSSSPKVDKALQEVRKVRARSEDRLKYQGRTETQFAVRGIKDPDDNLNATSDDQDGPGLSIRTVGGRVYVQIDNGDEVVFDQHGWSQVVRQSETAFQAVS